MSYFHGLFCKGPTLDEVTTYDLAQRFSVRALQVLLTFGFLVIGFTFSFLVQFRSEPPFGSPWQSFVKTMVMMTSEFDYSDLFTKQEDYIVTLTLGRLVFVSFLVLAAIVLMNLMVGLAVNDINDLEIRGKTQRLFKQVNFLCSLDALVYNETMLKCLPISWRQRVEKGRFVETKMYIYPGRPLRTLFKMFPTSIKEEIIQNAIANKRSEEPKLADVVTQLKEIKSLINSKIKSSETMKETSVNLVQDYTRKNVMQIQKSTNNITEDISDLRKDSDVKWTKSTNALEDVKKCLNTLQTQLKQLREALDATMNPKIT